MKVLNFLIAFAGLLIGLNGGVVFAQAEKQSLHTTELQKDHIKDELNRRELAYLLAPIKSNADLHIHLSTATDSPLDRLSSHAKWLFVDSLIFGRRGLGSYRYDILEEELTLTEIYSVLSLFGVQHTTPMLKNAKSVSKADALIMESGQALGWVSRPPGEDYPDYWCSSRATCTQSMNHICIGTNC